MFCWLRQWGASSAVDEGRGIPARYRKHAEGCAGCRAFLGGVERMEEGLRAEVPGRSAPAVVVHRWPRMGLAAAAAVVFAVAGLWLAVGLRQGLMQDGAGVNASAGLDERDDVLAMVERWSGVSMDRMEASSTRLANEKWAGLSEGVRGVADELMAYLPRVAEEDDPISP